MKLAENLSVRYGDRIRSLARAAQLEREGKEIINLGIGQPDFKTPEHIVEAAGSSAARWASRLYAGKRDPRASGSRRCRLEQTPRR